MFGGASCWGWGDVFCLIEASGNLLVFDCASLAWPSQNPTGRAAFFGRCFVFFSAQYATFREFGRQRCKRMCIVIFLAGLLDGLMLDVRL